MPGLEQARATVRRNFGGTCPVGVRCVACERQERELDELIEAAKREERERIISAAEREDAIARVRNAVAALDGGR